MADQRRFDSLEQTAAATAQRLDDKASTLANRIATHTHDEPQTIVTPNFYDLQRAHRSQGDTANRYEVFADGYMKWGPGNAGPDTFLYRESTNVLAVDPSDSFKARGQSVHEEPFARYTTFAATTSSTYGSYVPLRFPSGSDTHSGVSPNPNSDTWTLNISGVWTITVNIRLASCPAGQTRYLALLNAYDYSIRYGEQQNYQAGTGGSYNLTVTRRFSSGDLVVAGVYITGTGSGWSFATDTVQTNWISFLWVRS